MTISGEQILLPRKLFRSYSSRRYNSKVKLMDYQAFENVWNDEEIEYIWDIFILILSFLIDR